MIDIDVVTLSRIQFAVTAMYHFIFVPLTMGLVFLLAIMETTFVITRKTIWRDMTKFWGTLFGINFAMGVATGITLEFQFGTNWAYYSHYVGDIFGVPLAIEGMMAFFLEATFIGLFFFGWKRLSHVQHMMCTWILAIGTNLSALWILIANAWMQHPIGAKFNIETMRMEVESFTEVMLSPVAQSKFLHTVSAGYVTGSIFIVAISAWFLLRNKHQEIAKRSMILALTFGLIGSLSVVIMGDESGYVAGKYQKMKVAAIEAMWETEEAPAGLALFGIPSMEEKKNYLEVKLPWVLGLIATRSIDQEMPGIKDLTDIAKTRIRSGLLAYDALKKLKQDKNDGEARLVFDAHGDDLGHAFLLKKARDDIENSTEVEIETAAELTVPYVPTLFWGFRIMVGCGFYLILLFTLGTYFMIKNQLDKHRWFLWIALLSMPLPWIASEMGWMVAELGRQPWTIDGILPTFLSASSVAAGNVWFSLIGFIIFYSILLIVDVILMLKYTRLGPREISKETSI